MNPGFNASDRIEYAELLEGQEYAMFLLSPGDNLVLAVAQTFRDTPEFKLLFDTSIDTYKRLDYPARELPALRIYNENERKDTESWFVTGELLLDIIWPASLRRPDLQDMPDRVSHAIIQQLRRTSEVFNKVEAKVPGLNELGKTVDIDKSLGFEWEEEILPLTQIKANFRIDLRIWDDYLERVGRTKEFPFDVTLADLRRIATKLNAIKDDGTTGVEMNYTQEICQENGES